MGLEDRLVWMAVGCFIGFVLGYIVRSLRDIHEKVNHVDQFFPDGDSVESSKWDRNEGGFMRHPKIADIAMVLVIGLCVWAAFSTQKVNNHLNTVLTCITKYNSHEGTALESRDSKIKAGTQSEIELWGKYGKLYAEAKKDPSKIPALQETLNEAITAHRDDLIRLQQARDSYPYPDPDIVASCKEQPND